jgi:hypothetical protein
VLCLIICVEGDPALQAAKEALKKQQVADTLKHKIANRPQMTPELEQKLGAQVTISFLIEWFDFLLFR